LRFRDALTPIALVIAAGATATYAYLVDRARVSDGDREARPRDVFPSFRVEDVRRLELTHGTEVTVLERTKRDGGAEAWAMRAPFAGSTDLSAVDQLLRELEMAPRVRVLREDTLDAAALGLGAPRVRGHLSVGRLEYRFELGGDAPRPEGAAYMRVEGEGTFVVGRSLKVQLLREADTYRDHALVPYGAADVARLEVRAPGAPGFTVVRRDASFRVGTLEGLRVSRAVMDRVFGALADMRADAFVADADAERAAVAPAVAVTLTPAGGEAAKLTVLLGGPCPRDPRDVIAVRTEPSRLGACVAKGVVDALSVAPESLVDRGPFFAHADEMEEVRLETLDAPTERLDIARRGTGWHERSPEDRDLGSDEVDSANVLTLALASARSAAARSPEADEAFVPRWRATVFRTGASSPEVVEVAGESERGWLVRRGDDGAILKADRGLARRLQPHAVLVRSLAAARVPVDPGAVVAIDDSCTAAPERLDLAGGTWTSRGPAAFDVDAVAVTDLLSAFSRARADAWIAEKDDGTFGFETPGSCAVTLSVAGDSDAGEPHRVGIVFGGLADAEARDVNAHDVGDPAVFLAPKVLREIASHPAVDRSRFRLDVAQLSRVTLVHGAGRLLLVRPAGGGDPLVRASGSPGDAREDTVDAALSALYAQSALHTGPPAPAEGLDHPILEVDATPAPSAHAAEIRLTFGAPVHESALDGYFARASGVDATFLVPRGLVDAILDAW